MQLELTKVIVFAVVAERDDAGKIVGERETERVAFYTEEQLADYMPKLQAEIDEANAAERAAAPPNRAARRAAARK